MVKFIFLLILATIAGNVNSQNIFTALHLNENREYKTQKPKKIVETNTFHNPGNKQTDKNIKIFDDAGMLETEERFDEDGKRTARLTYTNDTTHKITLTRTFERWNQMGYSRETAFYSYDSNYHLIRVTDKDAYGNIYQVSEIKNNDKGLPVEPALFNGKGVPYGKEIATYFYDKNKVATSVISNDGTILSTDTINMSFKNASSLPQEGDKFNDQRDLVSWQRENRDGSVTIFEEEYTYDKFGNCTENKIYTITVKGNGERKKRIDRVFKKKYTY